MDDTPTPHASWATAYDIVNEQSFGEPYHRLTAITIEQIEQRIPPPARIVDFGAGTGRLSIPLASRGYQVVAVEPCKEMLDQLSRKSGAEQVATVVTSMQGFQSAGQFDMALCVFTVLLYLLDEDALDKAIRSAACALRPGGYLMIDIPTRAVFQSNRQRTQEVDRSVTITPHGGDLFRYEENTTVHSAGNPQSYTDAFFIRYWDFDAVMAVLARNQFVMASDLTAAFAGFGSRYLLMMKLEKAR